MQIQQVKCPNCGSPADIDDSNCSYCFARIPNLSGSPMSNLVVGAFFAFALGLVAADWFLGMGLTNWVLETWQAE